MKNTGNILRASIIAATLLSFPVSASADDAHTALANAIKGEPVKSENFANAVSDKELDADRGEGTSTFTANSTQNANVSNNSVVGGVTGNNGIDNGGLSGTAGIVSVIQNSGNNVVVQSNTIVNMTLNN